MERTRAGLESARARGKNGGRSKKGEDKINLALRMYESRDYKIKEIVEATDVSKTTLYRYIEQRNT